MWAIEIILQPDAPNKLFWLQIDAIITVGRSLESQISFPTDKSVSRNHATIELINPEGNDQEDKYEMQITDLGGKYGTSISSNRLPKNKRTKIEPGSLIQFGALKAFAQCGLLRWSFCLSRMEKHLKDQFQREQLNKIGASITSDVVNADYIVMNQFFPTLKSLTAIVLKKAIVTQSWLNFTSSDEKLVEIPDTKEFLTTQSIEGLVNIHESRESILKGIAVLILFDDDAQYDHLLKLCGASVFHMLDESTSKKPTIPSTIEKVCAFCDESSVKRRQPPKLAKKYGQVNWLTSRNLADAIMQCQLPIFIEDLSQLKVAQPLDTQIGSQYYTCNESNSGHTTGESGKDVNEPSHGNVLSEKDRQPISVESEASKSDFVLDIDQNFVSPTSRNKKSTDDIINKAFVNAVTATEDDMQNKDSESRIPEAEILPVPLNKSNGRAQKRRRNDISNEEGAGNVESAITIDEVDDIQSSKANVKRSKLNDDSEQKINELNIPQPVAVSNHQISLERAVNSSDPHSRFQSPFYRENIAEPVDGWLNVLRGNERLHEIELRRSQYEHSFLNNIATARQRGKIFDVELIDGTPRLYSQPITIERNLIKPAMTKDPVASAFWIAHRDENEFSMSDNNSLAPDVRTKDFRKFRKNKIIQSSMKLTVAMMEKVLPKESDKELQLRRESEEEEKENLLSEKLFSDRLLSRGRK